MRKTTTYVTVGDGSELHNHNIAYRNHLKHTEKSTHETVCELIEYNHSYRTVINNYFKKYIDEYNAKQDEKYKNDLERFNAGDLKNKPKKSNKKYKYEEYDFYEKRINTVVYDRKHNKKKLQTPFDEVVIGFGSYETRDNFTKDEVIDIMKNTLEKTKAKFPNMLILGATVHLDEKGNYHMHLDYLPLYFKDKEEKCNGLSVGINIDECMKQMNFEKEQALINKSNKVELYFNAFRNGIDNILEEELNAHNILVKRGVTADRINKSHIDKDEWLKQKIEVNKIQNIKNEIIENTKAIETNLNEKKNEFEDLEKIFNQKSDELENLEEQIEEYSNISDLDITIKLINLEKENKILRKQNKIYHKLYEDTINVLNRFADYIEKISLKAAKSLRLIIKKMTEIYNNAKSLETNYKETNRSNNEKI